MASAEPAKHKPHRKPAAEAAAAPAAEPATSPTTLDLDLEQIQRELKAVKTKLTENRQKLATLKDEPLRKPEPVKGPASVVIVHRNEMGGTFKPVKFIYTLDGVEIFSSNIDAAQFVDKELAIWHGDITPGPHTLSVQFNYQGSGHGVFAYLNEYTFTANGTETFNARDDRRLQMKVVGIEKGSAASKPNDRVGVEFRPTMWQVTAPEPGGDPDQAPRSSSGP